MAAEHTAFFYGTLMAPQVLSRVCHGSHAATLANPNMTARPALLPAFRRHKVRGADYPAILPHAGAASVRGTVVSGLTDGDMWRLDIFEGDEYERRRVAVRVLAGPAGGDGQGEQLVESGEEVEAEAYVWVAGADRLDDDEWDFREFVREKMGRWVGTEGEGEYKEVDEAVRAVADPTGGRGLNGDIGKAVEASRGQDRDVLAGAV